MGGSVASAGPLTTYAALVWPARGDGAAGWLRGAILALLGAGLLTLSAKIQVPGPVPTTLQTLAVLALGAMLGGRLAVLSIALYLLEGVAGLPVFAGTPPLPAGPAYLLGPTAGFLFGLVLAGGIAGAAADRGLTGRPLAFLIAMTAADVALLACGWLWLAFALPVHGQFGLGAERAFAVGIAPFWLGEAVKITLASLALPLALAAIRRFVAR